MITSYNETVIKDFDVFSTISLPFVLFNLIRILLFQEKYSKEINLMNVLLPTLSNQE